MEAAIKPKKKDHNPSGSCINRYSIPFAKLIMLTKTPLLRVIKKNPSMCLQRAKKSPFFNKTKNILSKDLMDWINRS